MSVVQSIRLKNKYFFSTPCISLKKKLQYDHGTPRIKIHDKQSNVYKNKYIHKNINKKNLKDAFSFSMSYG